MNNIQFLIEKYTKLYNELAEIPKSALEEEFEQELHAWLELKSNLDKQICEKNLVWCIQSFDWGTSAVLHLIQT